ncbi:MAG: glycosyltransferase family 4 protein [bacterium]|nr:glycosyltransferase family 4 protein [bacterium]
MKIGLISFHSFSQPGGVKRHVLGMYKEFKKRGMDVKIIIPRRRRDEDYGPDAILLGTSFPLNFSGSQADFCVNFNPLAIESLLEKEKFDILHLHNFGFPSAFQILERSKSLNVLTFHANIEGSKFFKTFPTLLFLFRKIVQWRIDGVIGVAPLILKVFRKNNVPKIVIPNGIDVEEFNPRVPRLTEPPFNKKDKIRLLFVGRLEKRKGLIYLLRAYKILEKKFSNLSLVIVGDGELKEDCKRFVKKNNLREVYFKGRVKAEKLPSYYASSDIFVSPAIFGESFGLVLLEAMASGLSLAGFANQGYKEFLGKKRGAEFLAKPGDWRELAQKLEILIKDPNLRKEMGEWGEKEAQNYSWSKIAGQILDFYRYCKERKQKREKTNGFSLEEAIRKLTDKVLKVF